VSFGGSMRALRLFFVRYSSGRYAAGDAAGDGRRLEGKRDCWGPLECVWACCGPLEGLGTAVGL